MHGRWTNGCTLMAAIVCVCSSFVVADEADHARLAELDTFWETISTAVETGDFETYRKTCHPDGVLVSGKRQRTEPLTHALKRWEKEFDDTREGRMTASASFRWTTRYVDATTAYEVGILRYAFQPVGGEETVEYVDLEAVLVKHADGWKVTCENQKGPTTEEAWNALRPAP